MSSLSRKALVVKGSLMLFLNDKLAQDAKLDLDALLGDIDDENYSDSKRELMERIRSALRGKLRPDASVGDLHQLLNALEGIREPEGSASDEPTRRNREVERLTAEDSARVTRASRFASDQERFLERFPEMKRVNVVG